MSNLAIFILATIVTCSADRIESVDAFKHGISRRDADTNESFVGSVQSVAFPVRSDGRGSKHAAALTGGGNGHQFTTSDRNSVVSAFNNLRGQVGASDMNYVSWSSVEEYEVANYTSYCDFDAEIYVSNLNCNYLKVVSAAVNYATALQDLIQKSEFYNLMTSKYVTGVSAGYSFCATIKVNGMLYNNYYFAVYAFPYSSSFNGNVRQYTTGPACTACDTNVDWCYNRELCVENGCDLETSGCCQITSSGTIGNCATTPPPPTTTPTTSTTTPTPPTTAPTTSTTTHTPPTTTHTTSTTTPTPPTTTHTTSTTTPTPPTTTPTTSTTTPTPPTTTPTTSTTTRQPPTTMNPRNSASGFEMTRREILLGLLMSTICCRLYAFKQWI